MRHAFSPKAIPSIVVTVNFITKCESHWKTASGLRLGPLAPIATTLVLFDQALHRERGQGRVRPMWIFLKDLAFHGPSRNLLAPEIGLTIGFEIRHHCKFLFCHILVVPCRSSSAPDPSGEFGESLQQNPSVWQWATPASVQTIGGLAERRVSVNRLSKFAPASPPSRSPLCNFKPSKRYNELNLVRS